jgi:hypothetical protein
MISPISVEMKTVNGCFVVMATAFTPAQGILALKWAMEPVNVQNASSVGLR